MWLVGRQTIREVVWLAGCLAGIEMKTVRQSGRQLDWLAGR